MSDAKNADDRDIVCKYLFYRYHSKHGPVRLIRLPIVHAYLKSPKADLHTIALVDSGATRTLVPREQANILELNYEKNKDGVPLKAETQGAGGSFDSLQAKIEKLLLLKNVTPFCTFRNFEVLIPEKEELLPYMVLGRDSIFRKFDVTFHETREKLRFTRI